MKRIEVNDAELEVLCRAVEHINDFTVDTMLENTSVNLFPRGEEVIELNANTANTLREELYAITERMIAVRSLMTKLGLKVNENGYSV